MKKIWLLSNFVICIVTFDCRNPVKNYTVNYVDRSVILSETKKTDPLLLIVGITKEGKLGLNKIETGTLDDISVFSEKLNIIFDDRNRAGIAEREVVIERQGNVESKDLEKLIEVLEQAKAAPILVIKEDL